MSGAAACGSDSEPITSSPGIGWKTLLAIWAAVAAVAVGGWLLAPHHVLR